MTDYKHIIWCKNIYINKTIWAINTAHNNSRLAHIPLRYTQRAHGGGAQLQRVNLETPSQQVTHAESQTNIGEKHSKENGQLILPKHS